MDLPVRQVACAPPDGRSGQLCDWMQTVYILELDAKERAEIVDIHPLVSR